MKAYTDKEKPKKAKNWTDSFVYAVTPKNHRYKMYYDFTDKVWRYWSNGKVTGLDSFKWFYPPCYDQLLTGAKELKLSSEDIQMLTNPKGL